MSQDALLEDLAKLSGDPLRWVYWAFPWGEEGSELADFEGPDSWQIEVLSRIRDGLLTPSEAIMHATTSGHGVGKSALVAWIILWSLSTFPDTRGVVTANTENQLRTKTWVELAKWYRLFIAKELFSYEATRIRSVDPEHADTWRIDMIPWSERNVEAFAGLHNKGRRILVVFDEASAIPDNIWETTEGALTDEDTEILWLVFGNPTRNTGRFRECFPGGKHATTWSSTKVDSRTVKVTNKRQIEKWRTAYGEDSDFFKVRVKGEFPRVGSMEFISRDTAVAATLRDLHEEHPSVALVLGVDVARFGDDETVLSFRKGRDARSIPAIRLRGMDTMQVAAKVQEQVKLYGVSAVFVDGGGVGGGVVDRLRQLRVQVIDVQFGGKSDRSNLVDPNVKYYNKRSEIWGALRDWLPGACIEQSDDLVEQLAAPQYGFQGPEDAIMLEKKSDMKKRGVASPDWADALALTFSYPIEPVNADRRGMEKQAMAEGTEYNPLELV